jgi:UDP-N-acetylmuramoyl-tripeptide--D-alanyl-D-alanine ligase
VIRELTLDDIAEVTGGAVVDGPEMVGVSGEEQVTAVSTDTRTLPPGALFVALRGERHDGHAHLIAAAARGANALMVEDIHEPAVARSLHETALPHVVVLDTLHALGDVARFVRDAFRGPVVGVTGSVGKTTTKELIALVLEPKYQVRKTEANHNNEIGVPQTIFSQKPTDTALVLEMGMRGRGQIARLCEIGAPTVGVITGIGLSHIELLGSRDAIASAKAELFTMLPEDGCAIYPAEDPFATRLRAAFRGRTALACSVEAPGDVRATHVRREDAGWAFHVDTPWGSEEMLVPAPGRFLVGNALLAIAAAGFLGVSLPDVAAALLRWTAPAMRMETATTPGGVAILLDAYNAAPDSTVGALATLAETPVAPGGRRIAALGEMRELGEFAAEAHRAVGRAVAAAAPDMLLLVGPLTGFIAEGAVSAGLPVDRIRHFASTDEAVEGIGGLVNAGDLLLVKGSRALAMERLAESLGLTIRGHTP